MGDLIGTANGCQRFNSVCVIAHRVSKDHVALVQHPTIFLRLTPIKHKTKNWAGFFKSTKLVSPKTPELAYNKYIKFAKDEEYHNISSYLYVTCFPDIAEPLTQMFPDPFDLVKEEIEGIRSKAKDEFEKKIKKLLF